MPLYEYRCTGCGERVEILQHVGDAPLAACARCGGTMEKLLSAPALQFRGSGWYVTDYAGKGNGNGSSTHAGSTAPATEKPAETGKPAAAAGETAQPAASAAAPATT